MNSTDVSTNLIPCIAALQRVGVEGFDSRGAPPEVLGCGFYGCAYPVKFKGRDRVMKVTADPSEADAARWIQDRDPPALLPQIDLVAKLGCNLLVEPEEDEPYEEVAFAIVREDLVDWPREDSSFGEAIDALTTALRYAAINRRTLMEAGIERALGLLGDDADTDERSIIGRNVDGIRLLQRWLARHDVQIDDVHPDNVGWREHGELLVIRDLGVSRTPGRPDIDELHGIRRRAGLSGLSFGARKPITLAACPEWWKVSPRRRSGAG